MKTILLVDDDPLLLRMYQDGLSQFGIRVVAASDGLEAIKALRVEKPGLLVLDLMMPRMSGVDVLKFVRAQTDLASLPVVALSNSYMNEMAGEAAALGVQKALLKVRCSPAVLFGIINDIMSGKSTSEDSSYLLAVPKPASSRAEQLLASPASPGSLSAQMNPGAAKPPISATTRTGGDEGIAGLSNKARRDFLARAPSTYMDIRRLCQTFTAARNRTERDMGLQNFYHKIHFVSAAAALAECQPISLLTSAFEALLFELVAKPDIISPSVLRTSALTVDFLGLLFDCARDARPDIQLSAQVLIVDDDPLSNRLVNAALHRAQLQTRSTEDPLTALQWLQEKHYDLILLDVQMPGMDGFELCKRLRMLPSYSKTPVIYVTSHSDFESRAKSVLSGGDDLISKPVFQMELAVKAVTHLLKRKVMEHKPA